MAAQRESVRLLADLRRGLPLQQRVAVTGMGVVTSIGQDVPTFWASVLQGRSGIGPIDIFDASAYPTRIAGIVRDYRPPDVLSTKEARRVARFAQMALSAAGEALTDSGLGHDLESDRAGVLMGSAIGAMDETQTAVEIMRARGGMRISPFFVVMSPANMAGFHVAHRYRLLGHNNSVVTACAAGTQAIGEAAAVIRRGDADVMVAGGTEAGMCELALASFCVGNAFSTRNDEPERASRPFDVDRDGFVGGEGAAVMVLERMDLALARGAGVHAEVLGYGASNDAHHLIAPDPNGLGALRAMRAALRSAGLPPESVDYVNAHGTGTPLGDVAETVAIKQLFGERAYRCPVSSTKSMVGHLFGAAGAVEGVATVLALREGMLPPTINLDNPDPECDLDYVPHRPRAADIRVAMSNSFGLGGQNAVAVFARFDGE
jgi:3-oxoacyl-[acyl-carrier-protein] synthase II